MFVGLGLEEILQDGNFFGWKAGDEEEGVKFDVKEGEDYIGVFKFFYSQWYFQVGG